MSEDPIGFRAADGNLIRYGWNRPVSVVDPSGLTGDGHHFVVQELWEGLSEEAIAVFDATRIRDDDYHIHNFGSIGGISHANYNAEVKKEFARFIGCNQLDPKTLTASQAQRFVRRIARSNNLIIATFNRGIAIQMLAASTKYRLVYQQQIKKGTSEAAAHTAAKAASREAAAKAVKKFWESLPKDTISQIRALLPSASVLRKLSWFCSVGGLSGIITFAQTRDLNAAGRDAVLDAVGLDLPVEGGKALAAAYDKIEADAQYTANEYKDDTEWPPPRKNLPY
jgi:hypothetical protein